jgi:hypothetical protein
MAEVAAIGRHGATVLPAVEVDNYNLELKDDEGFLGDRASRQAFHIILENWRKPLRKQGADRARTRSARLHPTTFPDPSSTSCCAKATLKPPR